MVLIMRSAAVKGMVATAAGAICDGVVGCSGDAGDNGGASMSMGIVNGTPPFLIVSRFVYSGPDPT